MTTEGIFSALAMRRTFLSYGVMATLDESDAGKPRLWPKAARLSSLALARAEHFLATAGFDRAPWLVVAYAAGIAAWFGLGNRWQWLGFMALALGVALLAAGLMRRDSYLRLALMTLGLALALGCGTIWLKSALAGTPPIAGPQVATFAAKVLERDDQPAQHRIRLYLGLHDPQAARTIRVRLSLPEKDAVPGIAEGAVIRLRARLMPPLSPQLPGAYDFARAAWFDGLAATGTAIGPIVLLEPAQGDNWLARLRHGLAEHIHQQIAGSAGGIAAAFASGDRGGIAPTDDQAMRDAGLTHLLSVSGLHVSAVVALVWFVSIRLLALLPWLALRVRLPLLAACFSALAALGYTLLTGAEVATVRSCLGAILVLAALALGRQPLSMRLLAAAAFVILLFSPESLINPGFQMSFGSVMAIIAVHNSAPAQAFLAKREEPWLLRMGRGLFMILLTGLVIDLALMPIALFHFHRAGIYGSLANVVAIPLTTFITMPLIALALLLDIVGAGGPVWGLVGKSLQLLLGLAHFAAGQPGAVTLLPMMGVGSFALFVGGMVWLALWRGRVRLLGLLPALLAALSLALLRAPDVLITGDGRNLGISDPAAGRLLILREGRTSFTSDSMQELTGMRGQVVPLDRWPGAQCNRFACRIALSRGGRIWQFLIIKSKAVAEDATLAAACASSDVVVAEGPIYGQCQPHLIRADRQVLHISGGLALDLSARRVTTVAASQGDHPWWRAPHRMARYGE